MYEYKFPMAAITSDVAIFRISDSGDVEVLTIIRGCEPYKGMNALIGGHCEVETETIRETLIRETKEEVGVDISGQIIRFVGFYDNPKRDTRCRVISFCYTLWATMTMLYNIKAGDDAESYQWVSLGDIKNKKVAMAFDHYDMVMDAWGVLE